MDNYYSCMKSENNLYCNVQSSLEISGVNSKLLEFVKNNTADEKTFNRNFVHRAFCLPRVESQNSSMLEHHFKKLMNFETQKFNYVNISDVEIVSCTEKTKTPMYYDFVFLLFLCLYLLFVAYATIFARKAPKVDAKETQFDVLKTFSLVENWKRRTSDSKNSDFQNLLSMQGLRFFLLLPIIYFHTVMINVMAFVTNPIQFEQMLRYDNTWMVFIVLPFFLMSSWLLILQVNNIYDNQGKLSFKNVVIIIINRYFRLIVSVAFTMLFLFSSLVSKFEGPLTFTILNLNGRACRKNWFYSLTLFGNYDVILNLCNGVSWYVSADFQVYVINLLLLYAKLKYNLRNRTFYVGLLLAVCFLHGFIVYQYGNDIIYTPSVRNFEEIGVRTSEKFVWYYTSTYSIWGCSIVGLIFGTIYYNIKATPMKCNKMVTILGGILAVSFPLLALRLSSKQTDDRMEAAFLASVVKPLFNLGFAIGLLGMAKNYGGFLKKVFEWKFFVVMGNFTFFTYLIHMGPILLMHSLKDWPFYASSYQLILDFAKANAVCWPIGFLLSLIIEEPSLIIQRKFLPQVVYKKSEEKAS
ncbi:unnamed protein product [Phyllotreta striolata]|uniref:Acyltransferase 3 domain-containing protein n=1 Tax=Phyllotreta striolata TaxID=444603 RepID=A0A9N9TJJ1_PHYSR|nr:unnamed protein product [Phyllotreta striolata]